MTFKKHIFNITDIIPWKERLCTTVAQAKKIKPKTDNQTWPLFMTVRATGEPNRACHWWRQGMPRLDLDSFLYESKHRNFIAFEKAKDNKRFLFFFFSLSLFFGWRHYSLLSIQVHRLPINRCILKKKYSVEIIRVFLRPCLCSMGFVAW